ncbi:hypothetical protein [Flavobacterium sp. PL02]|uniref:cupin domain-containing protein n=1 Tax=Flavobacterium sp. PL02 TaxID=3088354 RepID=UPI002B22D343|nr:hypothetical protein [Flavobacterium sp. PL02]MEA9414130.1 hypothetical protein [Flavobacterium sp. PL02]
MQATIINPAGTWELWTNKLRDELNNAENNRTVGEKLVFENKEFKVWTIHLPAGKELPFHKHCLRYFWTALSSGKSISYYNDGSVKEIIYEKGDTVYFDKLNEENFFIHNLKNTGETTLIFSTVEFKK